MGHRSNLWVQVVFDHFGHTEFGPFPLVRLSVQDTDRVALGKDVHVGKIRTRNGQFHLRTGHWSWDSVAIDRCCSHFCFVRREYTIAVVVGAALL